MLKDLIYLGVGSALLAKEKVDEELTQLIEKGKVSKEEAQKLAEEAKERAEQEEEQMKNRLKEMIKEVIQDMDLATKSDIDRVIKKIEENSK